MKKNSAVELLEIAYRMNGVLSNYDFKQAKEMEKARAIEYAEFCVRCDRAALPLVQFENWIKELTFKSE